MEGRKKGKKEGRKKGRNKSLRNCERKSLIDPEVESDC